MLYHSFHCSYIILYTVTDGDLSTYQNVSSSSSGYEMIPYKRPCKSLCVATTASGSTCGGLLETFGLATDCDALSVSASSIPIYDESDDASVCNALSSTVGLSVVADPSESYVGSACTDLVTDVYVAPPADPSFAPLLPPYVAQSIADGTVAYIADLLPKFLESSCLTSHRKYMCSLSLMKPHQSSALQPYLGYDVYVPSFPHYDICMDYVSDCASVISLVPSLGMNCSMLINGVPLFPTEEEVSL